MRYGGNAVYAAHRAASLALLQRELHRDGRGERGGQHVFGRDRSVGDRRHDGGYPCPLFCRFGRGHDHIERVEKSRSIEEVTFFRFKTKLYPLIAITASLFVIIFGLVAARDENLCWYLLGVLVWLCVFGCVKGVLKMLPAFIVFGGAFAGIAYASAGGDWQAALSMLNRFGALFLGVALSMSVAAVRMTRSLSQVHTPRAITLGMLISMSFVPMLKGEIKRVREAMKTRGAGSVFNPKILYRAFLVPLVMRLVNISDTLALSVETRGFTLGGSLYSVYKKEYPALSDVLFILGIVAGAVTVVVL